MPHSLPEFDSDSLWKLGDMMAKLEAFPSGPFETPQESSPSAPESAPAPVEEPKQNAEASLDADKSDDIVTTTTSSVDTTTKDDGKEKDKKKKSKFSLVKALGKILGVSPNAAWAYSMMQTNRWPLPASVVMSAQFKPALEELKKAQHITPEEADAASKLPEEEKPIASTPAPVNSGYEARGIKIFKKELKNHESETAIRERVNKTVDALNNGQWDMKPLSVQARTGGLGGMGSKPLTIYELKVDDKGHVLRIYCVIFEESKKLVFIKIGPKTAQKRDIRNSLKGKTVNKSDASPL